MAKAQNGEQGEKVETLHAQHGTPNAPAAKESREKAERGTGTSISIELKDKPELLAKIREAAKADDREPSKWLRRRLLALGDFLFKDDDAAE